MAATHPHHPTRYYFVILPVLGPTRPSTGKLRRDQFAFLAFLYYVNSVRGFRTYLCSDYKPILGSGCEGSLEANS